MREGRWVGYTTNNPRVNTQASILLECITKLDFIFLSLKVFLPSSGTVHPKLGSVVPLGATEGFRGNGRGIISPISAELVVY